MADDKDNKEKKDAAPKEEKASNPDTGKKAAANPDKEKKGTPKKAAAKKDSAEKKDSKEKKPAAKKEPKADKAEKPAKADKDAEQKPRRRAKKADKADKAEAKKPAPSRRRARNPEELPVVRASAKYVRVAPRKARLIADQVRGMHIEQARALLQFSPRGAAEDIQKLINSAAANAENNHDLVGDEMRITTITVDEGPTLRRFRPRALGRATPINKRTSHITVALTPVEDD
jgi:ribosomal protein L22